MKKSLKNKLKEIDFFGYPISLNIDKNEIFQTTWGGFLSMLMFFLLIALLVIGFLKVGQHGQDVSMSSVNSVDLKENGNVYFNETNLKFFHYLFKDQLRSNYSIEELRKNMNIYYELVVQDWYINNITYQRVPVKWCTQDDFGNDEDSIHIFASWSNTLIICPDYKDIQEFYLSDDGLQMRYSQINIVFAKCNSTDPSQNCNNETQIHSFLKDLQIVTYSLQDFINYQQYHGRPTFKYQNMQSIVYPATIGNHTFVDQMYLRKNMITTFDDYLQIGQISYNGSFYDISKKLSYTAPRNLTDFTLYRTQIFIEGQIVTNQRKIYSINDLLTDVGGTMKSIVAIFTLITFPISQHFYILKSIKRLFFVQTVDKKFFKRSKKKQNQIVDKAYQQNNDGNKTIRLSLKDSLLLLISQYTGKTCCLKNWKKYDKMQRFFNKGKNTIQDHLDIITIVKQLRNFEQLIATYFTKEQIYSTFDNGQQNILYIDQSESEIFDNIQNKEKELIYKSNEKIATRKKVRNDQTKRKTNLSDQRKDNVNSILNEYIQKINEIKDESLTESQQNQIVNSIEQLNQFYTVQLNADTNEVRSPQEIKKVQKFDGDKFK